MDYSANWTDAQIDGVYQYLKGIARPTDGKIMHYCWRDVDRICGVVGERFSRTFEIFFILVDRGLIRRVYVDDGFNTTELYLV
jgi:hypothetical protein